MRRLTLILLLLPTLAAAQVNVTYEWTAPTTGEPVDHYVVQRHNGSAWGGEVTATGNTATLEMESGWRVRVAGVDALGRQGPWSEESEAYLDAGAPGAPGKPSFVVAVLGFLGVLLIGLLARRKKED